MFRNIPKSLYFILGLIALGIIFGTNTVSATSLTNFGATNLTAGQLKEPHASIFPQNNLYAWNPYECSDKNGIRSDSCFAIDDSVGAHEFWYAEGCLNTGDCSGGLYYAAGCGPKSDNGLVVTGNNSWIYNDTQVDDEWGGMQYIYAENYDVSEYQGAYTIMTPNGGSSTHKYYWIVLPDQAYSNGFGDTYIATFENFSGPVYFIVFDTHACGDQGEDYCSKASADPEGVQIGAEFLGAFTKNAGSPTEAAEIAGKLTSLCRINGSGEVTAASSPSNVVATGGSSSSDSSSGSSDSDSSSGSISGSDITWIGDSYSCGALSIIKEKFSGISFGGSECDSNSYIMSNKGVGDRYGGGSENPPALTILKRIADAGELKSTLVMAVGTNAGWDDDEVNQLKGIMSSHPDTKVVLVNAKAKAHLMSDDNGTNDRLKALADSEDGYYLADWAAAYDESYFANNSTHPDSNGGYEKWVQVIYDTIAGMGSCGGKNPIVEVDGNQYMFPLAGAAKDNYLNPDGSNGDSMLSPMPCTNPEPGACHHDYQALDMGIRKSKVDGKELTSSDFSDLSYSDMYYYSTDVEALAFVSGEITSYGCYNNNVPDGYDSACKCASISFHGDDGIDYWIGHLSYDQEIADKGRFELGDSMGKVGPPPCAQGTQSHIHVDIQSGADRGKIYSIMNAAYEALPETSNGGSGNCYDDACPDKEDTNISTGGLTEEQAQKLAEYYNNGGGADPSPLPAGTRENCFTLSVWWVSNFTDVIPEGSNPTAGILNGGDELADWLGKTYNLETGTEPRPFSIFSTHTFHGNIHTGLVAAVDDSGSIMTIEAAYPSWADLGNGWARVFPFESPSGHDITFVYLDDHVDMEKLKEAIGG